VSPAALIPRGETELLVEEVLSWAAARGRADLTALDLGTGTGAIGLSLAFEGTFASVLATDVDEGALELARRNRDAAALGDKVELRHGALFDPVLDGERFDVVVSNPPYVAESEAADLEPEVLAWEPRHALFAGPDGLDVVRGLVAGAPKALRSEGLLALEVGEGQASAVVGLLEASGFRDIAVRRDYAGRERIVLGRRA
jgi:release factor glutamine methyltransferase